MKSKKLKKLLALALATTMLFSNGMMSQAFAKEGTIDDETTVHTTGASSGECGENLTWTLEDGTLTISGSGDMYDYEYYGNPWYKYDFNNVMIGNGVTSIGAFAFCGCSSLSSISIPESVTSIGAYAFEYCSSLSSISIPEGVTSIGVFTFYECSSLSSISIPEGVTSIGGFAFYGCSSLSSISIPKGVTSIGDSAFYGCSSLSSINVSEHNECFNSKDGVLYNKEKTYLIQYPAGKTDTIFSIPEGVVSIGDEAFSNCSSLTNISIPEGVISIGNRVFLKCSSLSSISIPKGVTSIGRNTFYECSSLSSINIPESITNIEAYAFSGCSSLSSISIPEGVTSINDGTFNGCSSLKRINILKGVTTIIGAPFSGCSNLTIYCYTNSLLHSYAMNNEMPYVLLDASEINVTEGVCGENLTWILQDGTLTISGSGAMYDYDFYRNPWKNHDFNNIIIGEGVTSIGEYAFHDCSSLSSISIPEGVTYIGEYAFAGCSSLSSISIPKGVTSIREWTFRGCSSLSSISIPEGVTEIGEYAFGDCSSLSSISIPKGVTEIGERAFSDCSSLSNISIPEGVTEIGEYAFGDCSSLSSISIPEGVTYIKEGVFYDCRSLSSISISEGVKYIGDYVFYGCSSLSSISIPKGVTYIWEDAFIGCSNVTIYCYIDSAAHIYAINNGISYELLDALETDISKATVNLSESKYTYDGTAKQPTVVVTLNDEILVKDTDYTVAYKNNVKVGTATVTVTGKGNYTGSHTKDFAITARNMSKATVTLSESKYTYDGTAKQPTVVVKIADKTLVKGTDYTVEYTNNINVGTATVTVTGKENYTGTVQATFHIVEKTSDSNNSSISINKAKVTLLKATYYFDGKEKTPGVTVKLSGKTLKKNTDYTVSYSKNKNIGTATVTIKGKGSYSGTVKKTFKITVKKGASYTVGAYKYKISSSSAVAFAGIKSTKTTKVVIPKTVKIGGKTFKVTSIASKALSKKTNVTSVTIGENVTSIGKEAFRNCSKLSTITIKSTKLKSVGTNACKGIKATAKIKVPSKKLSAYKKLLKGKGQGSKVKITK